MEPEVRYLILCDEVEVDPGNLHTEGPARWQDDEDCRIRELTIPIPWTEIVHIQFEVRRPVPEQPANAARGA
jgi:hypothetical protein